MESAACSTRSVPHEARALPGRSGRALRAMFSPPAKAMRLAAQESGAHVLSSREVASRNTRGLGLPAGTLSLMLWVMSVNFCSAPSGLSPIACARLVRYAGKSAHSGGSSVRTLTPARSRVSYVEGLRLRASVRVITMSGLKAKNASAPARGESLGKSGRSSVLSDSERAINDDVPSRAVMFSV